MNAYRVTHKYTGRIVMCVLARTGAGAKQWFTKNAKRGLSDSYFFTKVNKAAIRTMKDLEAIHGKPMVIQNDIPAIQEQVAAKQKPELTMKFKPVAYAGLFHVYINDVYIALADFDNMNIARDGKLVDFPHGYEYMFTELLDLKYVVTKGNGNGVYNIMNMDTHMLVGKIEISSDMSDIQYYPISVK